MGYIEEKTAQLLEYRSTVTKPADFDMFWQDTKSQSAIQPINLEKTPYDYPDIHTKSYNISFDGFEGHRIHGIYIEPMFLGKKPTHTIVSFHGYGGNCGLPAQFMNYVILGCAVLSIDCRGQSGITPDSAYRSDNFKSHAAKGLGSKEDYYYRKVYMDGVRAIDAALELNPGSSIIVKGGSQGGALTLAVCALDGRPVAAFADIPSNCDIRRRIETATGSFSEITEYLKVYPEETDRIFEMVSYVDNINLAPWIKCPVYASVGLKDDVCPAEFFFGAYNMITAQKSVELYPFNGHGTPATHQIKVLEQIAEILTC